jgi:cold shock protein
MFLNFRKLTKFVFTVLINFYLFFMKGKVKWFDSAKGYGFIHSDEGKDIFVHYTGVERDGFKSLEQGQEVDFEISDGKRGPQATNVKVGE